MTETYGVHLEMNPQAISATVRADGMNLYGKLYLNITAQGIY